MHVVALGIIAVVQVSLGMVCASLRLNLVVHPRALSRLPYFVACITIGRER